MRVTKLTAGSIAKDVEKELIDQVQRLRVVDTGAMKRAIKSRISVRLPDLGG